MLIATPGNTSSEITSKYRTLYEETVVAHFFLMADLKKIPQATLSQPVSVGIFPLTYWDRVTHIRISKLTIIISDNIVSLALRDKIQ